MQVNFDFETYSEADIRKTGSWEYSCHPSTEIICMAYSINGGDVKLWLPEDGAPVELFRLLKQGATFVAWNSFFELGIWNNATNWPRLPVEQTSDTAAMAAALAMPRALGACGAALGLDQDQVKDKRGKYLIQKLCKPFNGKRVTDPELLQELYDYCKQDVVAEMEIAKKLLPLNATEKKVWLLDQKINERGVYIDIDRVEDALHLVAEQTQKLNDEVYRVTDGELHSVSSRKDVMEYFEERGHVLETYQSAYIQEKAKDENLPEDLRRLLEIRLQTGKTSTAKYVALRHLTTEKSRAHGLLMYHGASTGRWSGKGFQPQNLPRGAKAVDGLEDYCIDLFSLRDPEALEIFEEPLEVLSSCIRGMICAPEGRVLHIADYSAIEARVLPWLAGQDDVLDVFRSHGKLYEYTASQIYGVPWESIGKNSDERMIGKISTLALGFGGGARAFQGMAENYGVDISEDKAEQIKKDWREANSDIQKFWWNCEAAALAAVQNPGSTHRVGKVYFRKVKSYLFCKLPSGRCLAYYQPGTVVGKFDKEQVTFMGTNSVTRKWERQSTYGGKLVENITQAVARDIMAAAMLRIDKAGYDIVLSVHDELIAEADEDFGSIEHFEKLMCELPPWAEGLPLSSEGFTAKRYRK